MKSKFQDKYQSQKHYFYKGSSSAVLKCLNKENNTEFAVKIMETKTKEDKERIENEYEILNKLS